MPSSFLNPLRHALAGASVVGVLLAVTFLVIGLIDISHAVVAVALAAVAATGTILLENDQG